MSPAAFISLLHIGYLNDAYIVLMNWYGPCAQDFREDAAATILPPARTRYRSATIVSINCRELLTRGRLLTISLSLSLSRPFVSSSPRFLFFNLILARKVHHYTRRRNFCEPFVVVAICGNII